MDLLTKEPAISFCFSHLFLLSTELLSTQSIDLVFIFCLRQRLTSLKKLITAFPPNSYEGCFLATNDNGDRLLTGPGEQRVPDLTHTSCKSYCDTQPDGPFQYFGIEFGRDCRCGNFYNYTVTTDETLCINATTGNDTEAGGGPRRISVWKNPAYVPVCT